MRHPEIDDLERFTSEGGQLRDVRPTARPRPARARMPARSAPAPREPARPTPADARKRGSVADPFRWTRGRALGFGLGGLALLGAATGLGYLWAEPWLWLQLAALLGGAGLGLAVPGLGRHRTLSRLLAVSCGLGLVGHVDPVSLAAQQGKSRGDVAGATSAERAAELRSKRASGQTQFPRLDLGGASLDGMNLREVLLDGSSLRGASCKGTDLSRASLINVDVTDADLSGAKLEGIMPGYLVGWRAARCDQATVMPRDWLCEGGHPRPRSDAKP
jgi:hypothetical protein